jgi:hypothetical protein
MITGIYVGDGMVIHFTDGAIQQTETPTISNSFFTSSVPSSKSSVPSSGSSVPSPDTNIPCPRCGDCCQTRKNGVISSCLDCFLSGGGLHLFLYGVCRLHFIAQARGGTCTLASSDPTEVVLHRALYLLENGFGDYHFYKNNCEDFAIYCKTSFLSSEGGSGQAASYWAGVKSMPLIGCAVYSCKRLEYDIGNRSSGETKVAVEGIPKIKARGQINRVVLCTKYEEIPKVRVGWFWA